MGFAARCHPPAATSGNDSQGPSSKEKSEPSDQGCTPANTNHPHPHPLGPYCPSHKPTQLQQQSTKGCGKTVASVPKPDWTHIHDKTFRRYNRKAENRGRCRCKVAHRHVIHAKKIKKSKKSGVQYFLQVFISVRVKEPVKQKLEHLSIGKFLTQ